jgi:uncharacterized protein (TIGR00255 family)
MALRSMTGFGWGRALHRGLAVEVELSAVNRKQFDVHVTLPRTLLALESRVYDLIHRRVSRGAVTGMVKVSVSGQARQRSISVDMDAARACVRELRRAARALRLPDDLTALSLVSLPEVIQYEKLPEDTDRVWPVLRRALREALGQLAAMREREGAALEADLVRRFAALHRQGDRVKALAPRTAERYRRALRKRLEDAGIELSGSEPALLREIALFADRCEITEELVRLDSHFRQVSRLFASREPVGRSLDFLCQEMLREVNTIGSKANDAAVSRHVIQFKAGLETIREQVQNLE